MDAVDLVDAVDAVNAVDAVDAVDAGDDVDDVNVFTRFARFPSSRRNSRLHVFTSSRLRALRPKIYAPLRPSMLKLLYPKPRCSMKGLL